MGVVFICLLDLYFRILYLGLQVVRVDNSPECQILYPCNIDAPSMATSRPILNLTIDQCLELIRFGNVMMVSLIVTIREFSPGWRHVCHGGCACS